MGNFVALDGPEPDVLAQSNGAVFRVQVQRFLQVGEALALNREEQPFSGRVFDRIDAILRGAAPDQEGGRHDQEATGFFLIFGGSGKETPRFGAHNGDVVGDDSGGVEQAVGLFTFF